jgi:hypothetical protein
MCPTVMNFFGIPLQRKLDQNYTRPIIIFGLPVENKKPKEWV